MTTEQTSASTPTNGTSHAPRGLPVGQILTGLGGDVIPAKHPDVKKPQGRHPRTVVTHPADIEAVLPKHLARVVQLTAPILRGEEPEGLIRSFVIPGVDQAGKLFTRALAERLLNGEGGDHRPEVILGQGTIGGIFAADLVQALFEAGHPVIFLPMERNHLPGAEGYNFLCPDEDIRSNLQGKRVLLALPVVAPSYTARVKEIMGLVEGERCAAHFLGIGTIIQYGELAAPIGDLHVDGLLKVAAPR